MHFDIYQTVAVGVAALIIGEAAVKRTRIFSRICLPAPVIGGLLISLLSLLYFKVTGSGITFDSTVKDLCMLMFFTSVGYQSNFTLLRKGGKPLLVMVGLVFVLMVLQNFLGVGISAAMGKSPLLGMAAGSISMCGGHGTAGGFSRMLSDMGLEGADSIAMAAATFGLIAGSLLGSPLADRMIRKRSLVCPAPSEGINLDIQSAARAAEASEADPSRSTDERSSVALNTFAVFAIFLSMGLGTLMNKALALLGISFPTYFGSLLVAALVRNVSELIPGCPKLPVRQITGVGSISLSLFLGIAMISLRLWELAGLALPMIVILSAQILLMWAFCRFVAFPLLGRSYDAAVLVSGLCGFGLGATPNAMANMEAVTGRNGYSAMPFLVVPLVGAIFVDILNVFTITMFLNFL